MEKIEITFELKAIENPQGRIKAKIPRKIKKRIIKVAGRDWYREALSQMQWFYDVFGYQKFNLKKIVQK